jgi:hypothetical protein
MRAGVLDVFDPVRAQYSLALVGQPHGLPAGQ